MTIATQNDIQKIRIRKKQDPNINLYILLDQTFTITSNAVDIELKQFRVTQPQVMVMAMLSREDRPVTLDELANWSLREFSSVYTLINRMEKKGLVKKIKKRDNPKIFVTLTDQGSLIYHQKVTERSILLIFNKLSQEEKKQLERLLKKVRDTTRDLLGLDFKPPFLP